MVSRTLSRLFLVGALNRPRKGKMTNRENPRTIPEQIGKIPGKLGRKDKSRLGNLPVWNPPRLAALDQWHDLICSKDWACRAPTKLSGPAKLLTSRQGVGGGIKFHFSSACLLLPSHPELTPRPRLRSPPTPKCSKSQIANR